MRNRKGDRFFTDEVMRGIHAAKHAHDCLHDTKVPFLSAVKLGSTNMVEFKCYYPKGFAVSGRIVGSERFGKWPNMTIDRARELAKEREVAYKAYVKEKKLGGVKHIKEARKIAGDVRGPADSELKLDPSLTFEGDAYEELMLTLMDAYNQAAIGKGKERHGGDDVPFEKQPMFRVMDKVGLGFATGQALKKICESDRMDIARAQHELKGAIIYLAGAIMWLDKRKEE